MLRKSMIIPTLLVTLPMLVVGWLALRILRTEHEVLEDKMAAAAMEEMKSAGSSLSLALKQAGRNAAARVAEVDGPRLQDSLHVLVRNRTILLATIYDDDRRLFPPEDGVTQDWSEQRVLQTADGLLASLRADLAGDASLDEKAATFRYGEDMRYALAYCRRQVARRQVCVMIGPDQLGAAIAEALGDVSRDKSGVSLAVVNPDGAPIFGAVAVNSGALATFPLGEPLQGWRLEAARSPANLPTGPRWVIEGAVVIPLLLSWLALAWHFNRVQTERLGAVGRRAELAAQLSHELRTPLANLRLYADLVRQEAGDSELIGDYCAVMEAEIDRLSQLAQTAVASAAGVAADVRLFEAAKPDQVLRAIVGRLEPLLLSAGCVAEIEGGADTECRFDVASFERICVNLLDNARKYAAGARIAISTALVPTSSTKTLLRLSVADRGPGVPEAAKARIFEPLQRDAPGGVDGFGLGLAAVRRLARANGGDAWVENMRPGARFTVTLQTAIGAEAPMNEEMGQ